LGTPKQSIAKWCGVPRSKHEMLTFHMRLTGHVHWAFRTRPGEDRAPGRSALCRQVTKEHVLQFPLLQRLGLWKCPPPVQGPTPWGKCKLFILLQKGELLTALLSHNHRHFRGKATLLESKWPRKVDATCTEWLTNPGVLDQADITLVRMILHNAIVILWLKFNSYITLKLF